MLQCKDALRTNTSFCLLYADPDLKSTWTWASLITSSYGGRTKLINSTFTSGEGLRRTDLILFEGGGQGSRGEHEQGDERRQACRGLGPRVHAFSRQVKKMKLSMSNCFGFACCRKRVLCTFLHEATSTDYSVRSSFKSARRTIEHLFYQQKYPTDNVCGPLVFSRT